MSVPRPRVPRIIDPARAPATVPPPLDGVWAPRDTRLDRLDLFPLPTGAGPEDVAVEPSGRVVAGGDDGRLWRWPAEASPGTAPEPVAETGGRPLGIEVLPDGSLIVCDAYRGLLRVTDDGGVQVLATEAAGRAILFCNNAAVAADGTVFFSDSSNRYPLSAWKRDVAEHRPNGRLLAYHPESRRAELVVDGLYFPNGVALAPGGGALLVAETTAHRLLRVPLGGGDPVVVADLPAYPDNVSPVGDGTYWVALPSPRVPIAERLLPHPGARRAAMLLPEALQPKPRRYGLVALMDADGGVLRVLHGPGGGYRMITGVRQAGDALWLGSLVEPAAARVTL